MEMPILHHISTEDGGLWVGFVGCNSSRSSWLQFSVEICSFMLN